MKKPLHIHIPKPCHEKWEEMKPTEQGAYCKACQKNVVDFTRKTQNEIYDIISQTQGETCGRFFAAQIQEPIVRTEINPSWFKWRAIAASLAALVVGEELTANSGVNNSIAINPVTSELPLLPGAMLQDSTITTQDDSMFTFRGSVVDSFDLQPLVSAAVILSSVPDIVLTDLDGNFSIQVTQTQLKQANYMLKVAYVGYHDEYIPLNTQNNAGIRVFLRPNMEPLNIVVGGIGGVKYGKVESGHKRRKCDKR